MSKDYYRILKVNKNASADEIKKSFHRLALLHHPDRNSDKVDEEEFKEINEAYQCLSNSDKRKHYDLTSVWHHLYVVHPDPYIFAEVSATHIKLNEEFEITYRYIGEGRFFRKPQGPGFVFTSGPVVYHREFLYDDNPIRETSLTYTVSARKTGNIIIDPATIEVRHKHLSSNNVSVQVQTTECFFKKGVDAGDDPLVVRLHKEQFTSNTIYRKTYTYRHVILIPRSDYAAFYHRIGSVMKGVFAVCGLLLFALKTEHALIGLLVGSLLGGILCHLMYWMSGVRSKYFYAYNHPLVKEYMEQEYEIGNDSANFLISDTVIQRFVMLFK